MENHAGRLTEALIASEMRLRRRLELLWEVVFEVDGDGLLIYANPAWRRVTNRETAHCLGQPFLSFFTEHDRPAVERALRQPGDTRHESLHLDRGPGVPPLPVELSLTVTPGAGALGSLHERPAPSLTGDEFEKLVAAAGLTDLIVIITDRHGVIEFVNPAFTRLTGYSLDEARGRRPGSLLQGPDTDRAEAARIGDSIRQGLPCQAELLNYTKAGAPYWTALHITPIRDRSGVVERFLAIQTDSTELRRARRDLESANAAKNLFLATISHEMRTPLHVILGAAELAAANDVPGAQLQTLFQTIQRNAADLSRLINDLLDVAKIEAGQVILEPASVDLRDALHHWLEPASRKAAAKGLRFLATCDAKIPERIWVDPGRLRQIVHNLAENAVKFTPRGEVSVTATVETPPAGAGPALLFRVVDDGPGIPEADRQRVFQAFEQADGSIRRNYGGTGLGLFIVQCLVTAMGGSVTLSTAPGGGAEFAVGVPLVLPPSMPRPASPPNLSKGRILVVEDANDNFHILRVMLTRAGYQVDRAANGRIASESARSIAYDLILMDIEMPEMDGIEATRCIRADESAAHRESVPIIAVTAHALKEFYDRCVNAGCNGFMAKPIRRDDLLSTVARNIRHAVS